MALNYEVIYLGQLSRIDTFQGDDHMEGAGLILGSYGSDTDPLYNRVGYLEAGRLSEDANDTYDVDNGGGYDSFRINGGSLTNFDAVAIYDTTITYWDGTTATVSLVVFQDVNGNTYVAPEITRNADQTALEEKPIESVTLNSVVSDTGDMAADRVAGDFKTPVYGTPFDEEMRLGYTTGGNDFVFGMEGNDTIFGDGGDDYLDGGEGNDILYGGTQNDTLVGGFGDDTITTGAGNDTIFMDGSGDDVVLDFDMSDPDGDGLTTDQLDISNLQTPSGGPVNAMNTQVVDDGNGNAMLIFPEGETLTLVGVSPDQLATLEQKQSVGIPCFTPGTMILTPLGEVPVEHLRPGDLVTTRDNGPQPVVWTGRRDLGPKELAADPRLLPVSIQPGFARNDRPLLVSPQHAILTRPWSGADEHLVRATHLARMDGGKVRIARGRKRVSYLHILFDRHQIVRSNGLWSESYYPGPHALRMMPDAAILELLTLFPDLSGGVEAAIGPTARTIPRWRDLPDRLREIRAA